MNLLHPPIWTNVDLDIMDTEEQNCNNNYEDVTLDVTDSQTTTSLQPTSSPSTPVQLIKNNMSNCNHINIEVEPNHYLSILEKSQMELPISTMEKLKDFEIFLLVPENYKSLVQFFAKLGGNTTYELIRRCIAPVIEDSLAEQFSFLGKKGKNTFGTTLLSKAVIEAAQKSGHASNNKETEQRIGDWLRRAKERNLRVQMKNKLN